MIPLARQDDFYVPEAVPQPETDTSFSTSGSAGDDWRHEEFRFNSLVARGV